MKSGRLSKEEWDYIKLNHTRLSYVEMARKLDRSVDSIRKFVEKKLGKNLVTREEIEDKVEFDVRRRPYWTDIAKQFNKDEQDMFVFYFKRFVTQFKSEVYATEEVQLVDSIKLEIMMNRLLTYQQGNNDMISTAEKMLNDEKVKDIPDVNLMITMQDQIATLRASQESISKEYRELQQEKNKLFNSMKATRDARIKHVENSKHSILIWLGELLDNTELRRNLGVRMEKMRLAMDAERKRLGAPHEYLDKVVDVPFLNCDTLLELENEGKETNE